MPIKLVLLDRDGVINVDRPDSVRRIEEFVLFSQAIPAVRMLNEASIPVAIITNQAVVGRGQLSPEGLEHIHDYLKELLKKQGAFIDKIYACTSADDSHPDRKPNPGLLHQALCDFQVHPTEVAFIGDALSDLKAGKAINCKRILVLTGKGKKTLEEGLSDDVAPVSVYGSVLEAVSSIVKEEKC